MIVSKKNEMTAGGYKLSVPPLTAKEQKWLQELEDHLKKCPSKRLEFVVGGDADIVVVDKNHPEHSEWFDFKFYGGDLATLYFYEGPAIVGMCK